MSAVSYYIQNSTLRRFRIYKPSWHVSGSAYTEFTTTEIKPNYWGLNGAKVSDGGITDLAPTEDVTWELAFKMGLGGSDPTVWPLMGGGHGFLSFNWKSIHVDGVDHTNTQAENNIYGENIVHTQHYNIQLPSNTAKVCGTLELSHSISAAGCLVQMALTPVAGLYEWYQMYAPMFPLKFFDSFKVGSNTPGAILFPPNEVTRDRGSTAAEYLASSSTHPYAMKISLPSGAPSSSGNWNDGGLDCAFWLDDPYPKFYATQIAADPTKRKYAGQPIIFAARYEILKP